MNLASSQCILTLKRYMHEATTISKTLNRKASGAPTSRIAITECPLVGLYDMRITGTPISIDEILHPVNASISVCTHTRQYQLKTNNVNMKKKSIFIYNKDTKYLNSMST